MKLPRIIMLATLLLTAPAAAQLQITPPVATPGASAEKTKDKPKATPHTITKKKEAPPAPNLQPPRNLPLPQSLLRPRP